MLTSNAFTRKTNLILHPQNQKLNEALIRENTKYGTLEFSNLDEFVEETAKIQCFSTKTCHSFFREGDTIAEHADDSIIEKSHTISGMI